MKVIKSIIKKTHIFAAMLLVFITVLMVAPLGFGWFFDGASSDAEVSGAIIGSYFESGDGLTEETAYEIARPVQMYYFAWLQNLGFFNREDGNGNIQQVYFKLSDKFDPTNKTISLKKNEGKSDDYEYKIPAIGTVQYPFVGKLNGNGITLTNVTVDNKLTELTDVPLEAETNDYIIKSGLQVIGLFGVVGSVGNELEGKYDTQINSISNMHLDNVEIKTTTPQDSASLIGIVAGYVNGTITGVTVNNSKITIASGITKLSDNKYENTSNYSIIGYCEDEYIDKTDIEVKEMADPKFSYTAFNAVNAGDEWGGSINMKDMYDRLVAILNTVNENSKFNMYFNGTTYPFRTYYNASNPAAGSYSYYDRYGNTSSFMYMFGKTFTTSDVIVFKNSDGQYMTINQSDEFSTTTSYSDAAKWVYTVVNEADKTYYLSCSLNDKTYYLINNNGSLSLTNTAANRTIWVYNNNELYSPQNVYLGITDTEWNLSVTNANLEVQFIPKGYNITINDGTNYLYATYNNTTTGTIRNSTINDTTVIWYPEEAQNGNYYYQNVVRGGTTYKYYLYVNGTTLSLSTTNKTSFEYDGYKLYYNSGDYRYFITYNGSWGLRRLDVSTAYYCQSILIDGSTLVNVNNNSQFDIIESDRNDEYYIKFHSSNTYLYAERRSNSTTYTLSSATTQYDNYSSRQGYYGNYYYIYRDSHFKIDENGNYYATVNGTRLYISGASSVSTTAPTSTITQRIIASTKITDGTNYLRLYRKNNKDISITNTTTSTDTGTTWDLIAYNDGYRLSTVSTNTYYLTFNGTTLTLGNTTNANNATTFYYEDGYIYTIRNNNRYYINYGTAWNCNRINVEDILYYAINCGSNYLTNSNTTLSNTTDINNASAWYQEYNNNQIKIYTLIGSTKYYLTNSDIQNNILGNNISSTLSLTNNVSNSTVFYNDGYKYYIITHIYVDYKTSWNLYTTENKDIFYQTTLRNYVNNRLVDTYFPLNAQSSNPFSTNTKNTGYVISGSNYASQPGDIRVSKYSMSDISVALGGSETYTASKLEIVTRTANTNGYARVKDDYNASNDIKNNYDYNTTLRNYSEYSYDSTQLNFQSYKDARNSLNTLFSGENNNGASDIYGLHFMDASIDVANYIVAPEVLINSKTYYNYQMPTDAIDFTLKEQGFITFFAGSYFSGNNSFFSLHRIFRNDDSNKTLKEIKEIKEIRSIGNVGFEKYFYVYSDGTCSEIIGDDGEVVLENGNPTYYTANQGNLVFDTEWIKYPTIIENAVYYFEFPALAGEYALGSVPDTTGAYLMYLDIAGGNQELQRDETCEVEITTTSSYEYPKGVMFGNKTDEFDNADSIAVALQSGFNGTMTYNRDGDNVTYSNGGSGDIASTALNYANPALTVKSNNVDATLVAKNQEIITKERLTFYDYNTGTKQFFKIVIDTVDTETKTNNVTQSKTRKVTVNRYDGGYKSSEDQVAQYSETPKETIEINYTYTNSNWVINSADSGKLSSLYEIVPVCQEALKTDQNSNGKSYAIKNDGKFYFNPAHDIDTSNIIAMYQYIKPANAEVTTNFVFSYKADEPQEVDGVYSKNILNEGYVITITSSAALKVTAWLPNALPSVWNGTDPSKIKVNNTELTTTKQEINVTGA